MATSKEVCVFLMLLVSSVIAQDDEQLKQRRKEDAEEGISPERFIKHNIGDEPIYKCPTPTAPPHGTITGDNYEMGSKITVHCDPGYTLVGNRDVHCVAIPSPFQKMALWDNIVGHNPHCVPRLYVRSTAKVIYGREKLRKKEKPASKTEAPKTVKRSLDDVVPPPQFQTDMGPAKRPKDDHAIFPEEKLLHSQLGLKEEDKSLKFKKNFCNLEKLIGPCRARKPRFHFNSKTNQCELFYYGGCRGNENNFHSKEECLKSCGQKITV